MKKNILKRTAVCALASIMLVGTVSGCSTKGNNAKKTSKKEDKKDQDVIVTIDDEQYTLADIMYYVYSEEETGALYSQIYEQFYGTTYWETSDEENGNKTGEDSFRLRESPSSCRTFSESKEDSSFHSYLCRRDCGM